ncbi:MAG: Lactate dehydrogenase-like protein [Candidatus Beckwithbacteria bacterium GW2011_GWC2_47_9]|uniref:Lactate dehydrogenase-like protein n=1 Tax=Candidatus Beckwithbacteria bacterium GW2011_GWC2_47_9 TaxID=1618373 RepID=A0A0G1TZI9_9BACT|nr:MAG: Lactate dehydrogenase-like protein [Parcubacteria group bacterium GW2011_GWA2_47_21]KKU87204.1 MAG: Lactate dehydrogenase-like protein [Candidatus Beckwithbacteria bacterium GW2011_GWC2_47_9]
MKTVFSYKDKLPRQYVDFLIDLIPKSFTVERLPFSAPDSQFERALKETDIAIFTPSGKYLPEHLYGNRLKLIQLLSSGYDKFNVEGATKKGIPVANNGGANAIAVAEYTILLILAVLRGLPGNLERGRQGKGMDQDYGMNLNTLHGKTVGIIGYGNIGSKVSERLQSFGAKILINDIKPVPNSSPLNELIENSDIITLHLRNNPQTAGIIGKKEFGLMKKGVILINTARPELIDDQALYAALKEDKLGGLGLDVVTDKKKIDARLLSLKNVIITPHVAGAAKETYEAAMMFAVKNFEHIARGEKPESVINSL